MKHSNRHFIRKYIKDGVGTHFVEVDGRDVKNKHGLDLFWHYIEGTKTKTISEGTTGMAVRNEWDGSNINDFLSAPHTRSGWTNAEFIKDFLNNMGDGALTPRYTNPDDNKPEEQKPERMKKIKFYAAYSINFGEVRERSGYLYEVDGVQYALEKVEYGHRVTILECGIYAGQTGKELSPDWAGFSQAKEALRKMKLEHPEKLTAFAQACEAYEARINKHMGGDNEQPMFKSVADMKSAFADKQAPTYYWVEQPSGKKNLRRLSGISGSINGINNKGEKIVGLALKGIKFTPNGFIIDGIVVDFRVSHDEIATFEQEVAQFVEAREEAGRLKAEELARQKAIADEAHWEELGEWANSVRNGAAITGTQFLELCAVHGVDIPIKVKGWAKKSLVEISSDRYRYSKSKSTTIFDYYKKLMEVLK